MLKAIRLLSCAALLAAASAFSGGAHAVFYNSHFDPIDFLGDGVFEFADSCLLEDGKYTGAECSARLVSAAIDIIEGDPPSGFGHAVFGESFDIIDLRISGGELVGVNTGFIGPSFAGSCTLTSCGPWWIQWSMGAVDPVFLYTGGCSPTDGEFGFVCFPNTEPVATAFDVTFTRISAAPEPGTVALLGCAIAACWAARRRRVTR